MAEQTAALHQQLEKTSLWLVGYSELKEKHFFCPYKDELKKMYTQGSVKDKAAWERVFVYQHFSMNRFTIDLAEQIEKKSLQGKSLASQLERVGIIHKDEIFGEISQK